MKRECCDCGALSRSDNDTWQPGEVCLFGMLFACSLKCAESYARREAREGYRPGEPGFDAVVELTRKTT